jgi:hypothetical protein
MGVFSFTARDPGFVILNRESPRTGAEAAAELHAEKTADVPEGPLHNIGA